jgi:hypothetical protein
MNGSFEQKRRLTDAGIAADENKRTTDKTTTQNSVEFGYACKKPLARGGLNLRQ